MEGGRDSHWVAGVEGEPSSEPWVTPKPRLGRAHLALTRASRISLFEGCSDAASL